MQGKRILVTGASDGIGKAAALELARRGADLVIAGRSESKTGAVLDQINAIDGGGNHDMLLADLSSIHQTKDLARVFLAQYASLDVLLNNAGAAFQDYATSVDGFEMTFALNHLSYFLLGNMLLEALKQAASERGEARIINVSSSAHQQARDGLNLDARGDASRFSGIRAYSESKLANLLFTYELARTLDGSGVSVNALHPGLVKTNIAGNTKGLTGFIFRSVQMLVGRSANRGAETLVYLAASPEVKGISGKYWADMKQAQSTPISNDREQQRRLWDFSAELTGVG